MSAPLNIAYVSKSDAIGGGASKVAQDLGRLFNQQGHQATHFTAFGKNQQDFQKPFYDSHLIAVFKRKLSGLARRFGYVDYIAHEYQGLYKKLRAGHFDLVHFHDLASAISPLTVAKISKRLPTCWTFHDCSVFTAGCLYPMECQRYKTGCAHCPQLGNWPLNTRFDRTPSLQRQRRRTAQSPVVPIAPSKWMAQMATESGVWPESPTVLYNGINTDIYKPLDKTAMRQKHNLPTKRPIVLIMANVLLDKRKGADFAFNMLSALPKEQRPFLLLIGSFNKAFETKLADYDYHVTGFVSDEVLKAELISACDMLLFTSIADNFPLVVLEAMACGCATVGFATGGVAEVVEHGVNGFLTTPGQTVELITGMKAALENKSYLEWSQQSAKKIKEQFSEQNMFHAHQNFYYDLLKKKRPS